MKQAALVVLLAVGALTRVLSQQPGAEPARRVRTHPLIDEGHPFLGRWDLTIHTPKETYPSWIEVSGTKAAPEVRIVGRVASVHPATDVKLEGSHLSFSSMESLGESIPVSWEIKLAGESISGVQKRSDGIEGRITGVRAPALNRPAPKGWSAPESLFNGKDLSGWEPDNPAKNHWIAKDGELLNQAAGANIRTTRKFGDFKLHLEYNCPRGGNSGVYLRGRYEVQVEYEPLGENDRFHRMGSIYGFIPPSVEVSSRPGHWESYDIMLIGRTVTVVRNDVKIIDAQEIPGITGGALDSNEGAPGPIYLQGDHTGGMKYRNIKISTAQR